VIPLIDYFEATYLAKRPARDIDSRLPFSETVIQHFSFKEVVSALADAEQDLINGLASLHKYFVILEYAGANNDLSYSPMMKTEIEYAFANHRAFYDCLHQIVCVVHKRYQPKSSPLSDSFAKVVESKTKDDLAKKFLFPQPLIDFYTARKDVFLKMRYIRDNIFHHGHSPDLIFRFPDGLAIRVDDKLVTSLGDINLWPDNLLKPNGLGSVLVILEFLVRDMFDAMEQLGNAFINCFQDPPQAVAMGYQVFLRSSVSKHLISLDEYKQKHWIDPKAALEVARTTENNA